jgi:hypothetical protein
VADVSALEADYGKWVGGVMHAETGSNDPIARNTMAAQLVAYGKRALNCVACDVIVIAVPAGSGDAFMARWVEGVGENPELHERVDL